MPSPDIFCATVIALAQVRHFGRHTKYRCVALDCHIHTHRALCLLGDAAGGTFDDRIVQEGLGKGRLLVVQEEEGTTSIC